MKENLQIVCAVACVALGMVLIFAALFTEPKGEIHYSVLVALGEVLTFAGSLLGIDYKYRFKR